MLINHNQIVNLSFRQHALENLRRGQRTSTFASLLRVAARVGMCDGVVPRGRRACVKPSLIDGARAPNLTVDAAQGFCDLVWWFYNQSGKDAVYLRGITECTVLAFRLCATDLGTRAPRGGFAPCV